MESLALRGGQVCKTGSLAECGSAVVREKTYRRAFCLLSGTANADQFSQDARKRFCYLLASVLYGENMFGDMAGYV